MWFNNRMYSIGETARIDDGERYRYVFIERSIQSVGPLKELYTVALPDRPVHSDTNSASPGSILARQQLCAMTIHSHFHHCPEPPLSIIRYSFNQLSQLGHQWKE